MKKVLVSPLFIWVAVVSFRPLSIGNEAPKVDIDILEGNTTFYFPEKPIHYVVRVVDAEDGSLEDGRISPDRVTVRMDYVSGRFDSTTSVAAARVPDELPTHAVALRLIAESDCRACHSINKPGVGPTYERIAQKYKSDPGAVDRLARKVIAGGKGVWGEATMSPHPQLSIDNASAIVTYILSLSEARSAGIRLPVSGSYTPVAAESENGEGYYRLSASYTDRGTQSSGPVKSEQVKLFRSPVLLPEQATWRKSVEPALSGSRFYEAIGPDSYLRYSHLDMTEISQLVIKATVSKEPVPGGSIEVRLDSLTGKLIGSGSLVKTSTSASINSAPLADKRIGIILAPAVGIHDVYFLFKNPHASPQQRLAQVESLTFKSVTSASDNR
ncbi:hypothetical protein GCM10023187_56020 [Nibrella viscosa]|uniref:Cytochrome c domain-containing protein n=1 Tax=Nibrella viscosa TaxID=1084524 RepID=A0ABP8L1T8_9BACT